MNFHQPQYQIKIYIFAGNTQPVDKHVIIHKLSTDH